MSRAQAAISGSSRPQRSAPPHSPRSSAARRRRALHRSAADIPVPGIPLVEDTPINQEVALDLPERGRCRCEHRRERSHRRRTCARRNLRSGADGSADADHGRTLPTREIRPPRLRPPSHHGDDGQRLRRRSRPVPWVAGMNDTRPNRSRHRPVLRHSTAGCRIPRPLPVSYRRCRRKHSAIRDSGRRTRQRRFGRGHRPSFDRAWLCRHYRSNARAIQAGTLYQAPETTLHGTWRGRQPDSHAASIATPKTPRREARRVPYAERRRCHLRPDRTLRTSRTSARAHGHGNQPCGLCCGCKGATGDVEVSRDDWLRRRSTADHPLRCRTIPDRSMPRDY